MTQRLNHHTAKKTQTVAGRKAESSFVTTPAGKTFWEVRVQLEPLALPGFGLCPATASYTGPSLNAALARAENGERVAETRARRGGYVR